MISKASWKNYNIKFLYHNNFYYLLKIFMIEILRTFYIAVIHIKIEIISITY